MTIIAILIATGIISLGGFIGVITFGMKLKTLEKWLHSLVALSAGTLLGGAFLHLFPEAAHSLEPSVFFPLILFSFIIFFFIEKVFHWRHCHKDECEIHSFGYMNLIGDAVHNFLDGVIIAGAFAADIQLGIITTVAVALHEIPQEISDFGVLLHAGFSKKKAITANVLVALTAILGGIFGYYLASVFEVIIPYMIVFAGSGFLYIAASDLIPEIRQQTNSKKVLETTGFFLLGIILTVMLSQIIGDAHSHGELETDVHIKETQEVHVDDHYDENDDHYHYEEEH